jgi:hypothetical protein
MIGLAHDTTAFLNCAQWRGRQYIVESFEKDEKQQKNGGPIKCYAWE